MKPKRSTTLALIVLLAVSASAVASGDSYVVRAKRILPVALGMPWVIEDGKMIVRDGRIVAVGANLDVPPDLSLIDLPNGTVMPGLVAAASGLGGRHVGDESVAAGYRAADAFDRYGNFATTLAAGVTTIHLDPGGHRLVTGQGAVVKLGGPPSDRVLRAQADLAVNLGPDVFNPPPDVSYSFPASADVPIPLPRRQRPASRMGQLLALEEAVRAAAAGDHVEPSSIHGPALARAWQDGLPLRMRAERSADLLSALKFLRQQQRGGYVVGGAEAGRVADAIRAANVSLVVQLRDQFRSPGGNIGTDPAALDAGQCDFRALKGVRLALAPPVGQAVGDLRLTAIRAGGAGLGPQRAIEAITRVPAEILGVADRIGSLAPGKDADFLVLTGDPLLVSSHVQQVYVRGRRVFEPPSGGALVVKAGTVWAGPGKEIRDGEVLIEDGKIVAVGRSVPHPPFARVIDASPDGFITPGLIDAHSHLGLHGDRTSVGNAYRLSKLVGVADVTDRRVCTSGITTVLVAPYAVASMGSPFAAVKTAGTHRKARVIRDPAAVLFDVSRADPAEVSKTLDKPLAAGKIYLDAWEKYEKDLKAFLEKQKKGEKPKEVSREDETERLGEPDPITGTWEATVSGGPVPQPISVTIVVQLTGSLVEGRITRSSMGVTGRITGTFDGKHISATIEMDVPGIDTPPQLEADLVGEDHFKGTVTVAGMSAEIEGRRVDKSAVEMKVTRSRRRSKDGRPMPPKVDASLEPLRAMLQKKIPAVVKVSTPAQIREVLALLVEKHKLPVTLLNAEGASVHAQALAEKKVAVIVPPAVLRQRQYRDYLQADDLARRGVSIALQSNAEDGARNLPAAALYAVERGLSAEEALKALTVGAARALKIDDRVGTIEPGKDADLVIFSGHPFRGASRVLSVVVGGEEVRP